MAAHERSLQITDQYRRRLQILRQRATAFARVQWQRDVDPAALDVGHTAWVAATSAALTELQRTGEALSHGYLAAFLTSELGRRVTPPTDVPTAAGQTRDGRPLADALTPSLYTIKQAIGEGRPVTDAMGLGLNRAL